MVERKQQQKKVTKTFLWFVYGIGGDSPTLFAVIDKSGLRFHRTERHRGEHLIDFSLIIQ